MSAPQWRDVRILALVLQSVAPVVRHAHEMSLLERLWKYTAIGASSIVFEEANPILGGIAVRHGRAGAVGIEVAITVGTWLASMALYYIGRLKIDWVRDRWPNKRRLLDGALQIVQHNPWRASLAIRFAWGLRLPLPIACGAAGLPVTLYAIAAAISCGAWAAAFTLLGYLTGFAALQALRWSSRLDVRLGFLAVILSAVLVMITRRRLIAERTAEVLTGEHIPLMNTAERPARPTPRGGPST